MCFEQYSHEPNIATLRFWTHAGLLDSRAPLVPGKREAGMAALGVMEGQLAQRRFFVGERYTIADVALYAYTHVAEEGGFALASYPAIRAWLARVAAQPGHVPITQG
jgi:glutathione S-transferase